ncbi:hypothetical protein KFL_000510150 [Klebsormidium nitens]|uniref:Uncharacterized protein n=1 Tax=Klebsormidium nitens TaxID=105231 RepID=A0A1Y1HNT6_KLENI|nr:hypothetical protein KFL_000510150 [Klebsormidium nitens]|eukprot:GAQ80314.1 hypothetical protein KFL_000510150 [Klebsormidium nitens]
MDIRRGVRTVFKPEPDHRKASPPTPAPRREVEEPQGTLLGELNDCREEDSGGCLTRVRWRKGDQTAPVPKEKEQQAEGEASSELRGKQGLSNEQKRITVKEYEVCKQAALSKQKTLEDAAESLKKEMDSAREQHGCVDMANGPQTLLDAAKRFEEAKDAYLKAIKVARQARQDMGAWNRFINDLKEGAHNGGRVRVWT